MQKNKNRKGLALGAVFALVTSLFVASPSQANETAVVAYPTSGLETQTQMLHGEAFDLTLRYGTGVAEALRNSVSPTAANLGVIISKPAGVTLSATAQGTAVVQADAYQVNGANRDTLTSNVFVNTASPTHEFSAKSSFSGEITLSLPGRSSVSSAVSLTVTPFLDLNRDGNRDNGETLGNPITVTFVPWSALGAKLSFPAPLQGNVGVTASVTVDQGTINWAQLDGQFTVLFSGTVETETGGWTASAGVNTVEVGGAAMASGGYSFSGSVATNAASGSPVASYSARLMYEAVGAVTGANAGTLTADSRQLLATATVGVVPATFTALSMSSVAGVNLTKVDADNSKARPNSTFVIDAYGITTSKVAGAVEVTVVPTGLDFSATQGVTINGVTYTSSTALQAAKIVGGTSLITVTTFGQTLANGSSLLFKTNAQLLAQDTHTVTLEAPVYKATVDGPQFFATAPNTAVTLNLEVKDQYGVLSGRQLQRVSASALLGTTQSAVVTAEVVNGKATVAVTATTGTNTGSAGVTLHVEHFNQATGLWGTDGNTANTDVKIEVTTLAFGFTASPDVTASASISYALASGKYSWSNVISGSSIVAGTLVTVAGKGLVFSADGGTTTASDSLTFRTKANGKFDVNVAGTKAGEHEITFTAGAAKAVTTLTIDPAVSSAGTKIEVTGPEKALPNRTLTYTGSVVDALGNPVADADITVTVLGPVSLILGSQAVKTDVDGEFTFRVQTSANDEGDISVTATYNKNGSATLAKDKISDVALTTVAAPVVVTADKVTVAGAATLTSGLSTDVVVTVVDAAGKPLAGRTVSLRSSGPGFLNVQSAVSDTDGKVAVKFIATTQTGEVVITAVVDGKVGTHTLKVEAPVVVVPPVVPAPEVNAVIGSFNGRWAVRVENAKGSVVSVKVGNRWFKFNALNDNYMFSAASRTGATLPIAVYVNGQLENVATITVK